MRKHGWVVVVVIFLASGCSGGLWSSKNTLDKNPLAKFGQKKAMEDAKEKDDPNSAYEAGDESIFSLGDGGGLFGGGGGGKSVEDIRADKLFAGAMEVVMNLPIQVADREGGIISTNWKIDPNHPGQRYRVNIHVTGREPYGDVRVAVLKQQQVKGTWQDRSPDAEIARNITKSIRKRAQLARP